MKESKETKQNPSTSDDYIARYLTFWSQTFRKLKSNPNFHHLLSGSQQFINSVIKPQNAANSNSSTNSVSPSPSSVNSTGMSHTSESSSNCSRISSTVIKVNPSNPPSPGGSSRDSRTSSGSPRLQVIEDDIKLEP